MKEVGAPRHCTPLIMEDVRKERFLHIYSAPHVDWYTKEKEE